MQGTVTSVQQRTGRTSGSPFEVITIDDQEYSMFDNLGTCKEGDLVEFEFKESGKYKNITSLEVVKSSDKPSSARSTGDEIRRMSVLRTSVEFHALQKNPPTESDILNTATRFSQFVMGVLETQNANDKLLENDDDLRQEIEMLCQKEGIGLDTFNEFCRDKYICELLKMRVENIKEMVSKWESTRGEIRNWKTNLQKD